MIFVDMYNDGILTSHTPFESKTKAIEYFNYRLDMVNNNFPIFDRIEIIEDNCVLFDYEV